MGMMMIGTLPLMWCGNDVVGTLPLMWKGLCGNDDVQDFEQNMKTN